MGKDFSFYISKIQYLVDNSLNVFQLDQLESLNNKGAVGLKLERYLGLSNNNFQEPDGGDWELKTVKMKRDKAGVYKVKETVAVTMINQKELTKTDFIKSHLYSKIKRVLLVAVDYSNPNTATIVGFKIFNLEEHSDILENIKYDYYSIQKYYESYGTLTGKIGEYIQARTKGAGGNAPKTRAFYLKTNFLNKIFSF